MQSNGDKVKVPAPMVSFEDTSEAYEAGYRDGMNAGMGETEVDAILRKHQARMDWCDARPEWTEGDMFALTRLIDMGVLRFDENMNVVRVK